MLDKMKDIGSQLGNKAVETADGIAQSVKNSVTDTASNVSEKAVRASIEQMRNILAITVDELKNKPVSELPATITASVTVGIISLQIEITTPELNQTATLASE